jgi:hypothetical protein
MAREMKASGVEWVDKIPATWEIVNLRQVFSLWQKPNPEHA